MLDIRCLFLYMIGCLLDGIAIFYPFVVDKRVPCWIWCSCTVQLILPSRRTHRSVKCKRMVSTTLICKARALLCFRSVYLRDVWLDASRHLVLDHSPGANHKWPTSSSAVSTLTTRVRYRVDQRCPPIRLRRYYSLITHVALCHPPHRRTLPASLVCIRVPTDGSVIRTRRDAWFDVQD
jgi:hypothetical protein